MDCALRKFLSVFFPFAFSPVALFSEAEGCTFFTSWSLHSIQCSSLSIYRMTNKIMKMPSFPQPAFFKFGPISFWQGVYEQSFISGPAPAPHLTLSSFLSFLKSIVILHHGMWKKSDKVFVVFQEHTREISKCLGLHDQAKASVSLSLFGVLFQSPAISP